MKLPIDIIPNRNPPHFKWEQVFDEYGKPRVIQCEGTVPVSLEKALVALIELSKQQTINAAIDAKMVYMGTKKIEALEEALLQAKARIEELTKPVVLPQGKPGNKSK